MNRLGLGLAIGAGYVLGRTKKMKLAFAVGTMVAGKRMQLSPRALADLVSQQLQNNPQFKEIGDQLREDLRGVGKAATGALVERQIEGLADRLHGRTSQVRDQLAGAAPDLPGRGEEEAREDSAPPALEERGPGRSPGDGTGRGGGDEKPRVGHDASEDERQSPRKRAVKKAPAKKTAAPSARKATPRKAAAKKTAAGSAPAKKAARKATRARTTRGGGGDD
ncbi:DNA primase [Streptomyces sp. CA-210063]|uniref:DNA primase n=1 Tax=Streptomyces sp. CA-210063 TaxID=2801029 RepID=UPI00214C2F59|nr:DNA primase [Streptomyces sp. CA-210063]UUU29657.1 DNA primase [Streptomyces sp. CA-210063]